MPQAVPRFPLNLQSRHHALRGDVKQAAPATESTTATVAQGAGYAEDSLYKKKKLGIQWGCDELQVWIHHK